MKILNALLRRRILAFALLALVLAAACVPIRREARWPSIELLDNGEHILLTYNDKIVMLNTADGTQVKLRNADGEVRVDDQGNARLWDFEGAQPTANQFYSAPVLKDANTLIVPAYNHKIYEVDLATARAATAEGRALDGQVVASGIVANNLLYLGVERTMVALNLDDMKPEWSFLTHQVIWSKPLIYNDVLYFTSLDHHLYALNPETGEEIWNLPLDGAATEGPVLYKDHLYLGTFARQVLEISLDGEVLATYNTKDWVWGAPTIVDDVAYVADLSGMVYALDVSGDDFSERWTAKVSEKAIRMSPLVSGEYVVVGSRDHKLYGLHRTDGSIFWSEELQGEVVTDLVLVDQNESLGIKEPLVLAGTPENSQLLAAYTLQNGSPVWGYGR